MKIFTISAGVIILLVFISIKLTNIEKNWYEREPSIPFDEIKLSSIFKQLHAGPKNSTIDVFVNGCILTWMVKHSADGYKPSDKRVLSSTKSIDIRTLETDKNKVSVRELTNNVSVIWDVIGADYSEALQVLRVDSSPDSAKAVHLLRENVEFNNYPNFTLNAFIGTKTALIPINQSLLVFSPKPNVDTLIEQVALFGSTCAD